MAFSLALIIIAGLGADYLFRLMRLPGLVGMLLVGVLRGAFCPGPPLARNDDRLR